MSNNYLLKPIRIPSGWLVVVNRLYDVNIDILNLSLDRERLFVRFLDTGLLTLQNDHANLTAYIDWLPAMEFDGKYYLKIYLNIEESNLFEEKFTYSSRDLNQVISVLEDKLLNQNNLY